MINLQLSFSLQKDTLTFPVEFPGTSVMESYAKPNAAKQPHNAIQRFTVVILILEWRICFLSDKIVHLNQEALFWIHLSPNLMNMLLAYLCQCSFQRVVLSFLLTCHAYIFFVQSCLGCQILPCEFFVGSFDFIGFNILLDFLILWKVSVGWNFLHLSSALQWIGGTKCFRSGFVTFRVC